MNLILSSLKCPINHSTGVTFPPGIWIFSHCIYRSIHIYVHAFFIQPNQGFLFQFLCKRMIDIILESNTGEDVTALEQHNSNSDFLSFKVCYSLAGCRFQSRWHTVRPSCYIACIRLNKWIITEHITYSKWSFTHWHF